MNNQQKIPIPQDKSSLPALWTRDFVLITAMNVLLFVGMQTQLSALPVYLRQISGSDATVGLAIALGTASALIARPLAGYTADRFGRAPILFFGLILMITAMFSYSWFPIVWVVILIRSINGLGWGTATTLSNTVATDVIPEKRLGEGMGFFSLSQSVSMALAPAIGLSIMSAFGYRNMTFFAFALLLAACIPAALVKYRRIRPPLERQPFVPFEKSAIRPAMVMTFVGIPLGAALSFSALYGIELGIGNGALFLSCFAISMFVSRPIAGRMIDRLGFHKIMYPGFILYIISMALLSIVKSLPMFLGVALLQGVAYGVVQNGLQTKCLKYVSSRRRGAANATFFTFFDLGIGLGNLFAGVLAAAYGYARMYFLMIIPLCIGCVLYYVLNGGFSKKMQRENLDTADGIRSETGLEAERVKSDT